MRSIVTQSRGCGRQSSCLGQAKGKGRQSSSVVRIQAKGQGRQQAMTRSGNKPRSGNRKTEYRIADNTRNTRITTRINQRVKEGIPLNKHSPAVI